MLNVIAFVLFVLFRVVYSGGGMSVPPHPSMVPGPPQSGLSREDRYAALAELDSALSYSTSSGGPPG